MHSSDVSALVKIKTVNFRQENVFELVMTQTAVLAAGAQTRGEIRADSS